MSSYTTRVVPVRMGNGITRLSVCRFLCRKIRLCFNKKLSQIGDKMFSYRKLYCIFTRV